MAAYTSPLATMSAPQHCPGAPLRIPVSCMVDLAEALYDAGADTAGSVFTVFAVHPVALAASSMPRLPVRSVRVPAAGEGAEFVIDSQLHVFKVSGGVTTHAFKNLSDAELWFLDEDLARHLAQIPENARLLASHALKPRVLSF
jgi:hypothetical protein